MKKKQTLGTVSERGLGTHALCRRLEQHITEQKQKHGRRHDAGAPTERATWKVVVAASNKCSRMVTGTPHRTFLYRLKKAPILFLFPSQRDQSVRSSWYKQVGIKLVKKSESQSLAKLLHLGRKETPILCVGVIVFLFFFCLFCIAKISVLLNDVWWTKGRSKT